MKKNSVRWAKKQWEAVELFTKERRELEQAADAMEAALAQPSIRSWFAEIVASISSASRRRRSSFYIVPCSVVHERDTDVLLRVESLWTGPDAVVNRAYVGNSDSLMRRLVVFKNTVVFTGSVLKLEFRINFL